MHPCLQRVTESGRRLTIGRYCSIADKVEILLGGDHRLDWASTYPFAALRGLYGDRVWRDLFGPLFGSKFGAAFGDVPALYLWERLGRERNVAVRGYPRGGYKAIIDALRASIESHGGIVRTSAPVRVLRNGSVELDGETIEAGRIVSTLPLPALRQVADAGLAPLLPRVNLRYQGVVNALFVLRQPLSGHYWTPVLRSGLRSGLPSTR